MEGNYILYIAHTLVVVGLSLGGGGAAAAAGAAPSFLGAFPPLFLLVFLLTKYHYSTCTMLYFSLAREVDL